MWYVTPTSVILIVSGWLISVIALYAWNKHANIGFAPFFLLLGDALWKVCFGIALGTHDLPARLFWTSCQYIGIGLQIIGTTLLAMTYAGKENWLTPRRNWLLIALIPALSVLLAFSNDAHRLMWVQAQLLMHDNLATLDFQFGPLYWIYIFYNFLVVILTALILARASYRSSRQQRNQALILMFGILLPVIFHSLYLTHFKAVPLLELASAISYSFTGLVITWGLLRYPLLEALLIPPARVVQEMPDAVMVMDNRSLLVDVNPAALRLLGLPKEQVLGNSLQYLERHINMRPGDADMLRKYQDTLEAQEEIILGTIESPLYFNMRISPLYNRQQQLSGRLVVLRDVTELQRREQALKEVNVRLAEEMAARESAQQQVLEQERVLAALDEREQLGGELHDGLGQMMGYLNVEAQTAQTLLENNDLAALRASLAHLANVARDGHDDLRAFILGMRPVSHNLTLPQTLGSMLEQFSQNSGANASLDYPENAPEPAFTPAVETVVVNVMREALSNIRKHAEARQVSARFNFVGELAQIDIADDGKGFSTTGRLFSPRPKPGDKFKDVGAHFGLAVMRERVEQAGGRFEIHSAPGKGTRVRVQLPCLPLHADVDVEDMRAARGLRILLVDDHPLFLEGLRNLLQARGLTVVGLAHDGLQAQAMAEALRPDVVVMDVNMPGCDGLEATRNLKAALPETQVVILTVSEDEDNLYEAIQSGASGYLLKSLEANEFVRLLAGLSRGELPLTSGIAIRLMQKFDRRQPIIATSQPQDRPADRPEALNGRQWTILQYVAQGLKYKEIAVFLNVSERTVKREMSEILDALHLETRREALKVARHPASAANPEHPPQK